MEFDINNFLKRAGDSCNSKDEFIRMIDREDKAASQINAGKEFLARESYRHNLAVCKIAAKAAALESDFESKDDLINLLDSLAD